ncbi:MAG: MurR/RpiR family transcriptional regulator, partial [Collinsella sp.]|nr:MurR/RpiR family transcriptional regulator [Collinsella sp.]MDY5550820.1 MurR/RpiR family transcriptional regulator [Collinsella sp.]
MKDQESFYDHVRAGESKLNDLESEIMRYIIELRDDIDDVTLKSVAERFFVAPNTIVRLAHKLGFSGFTELKQSYSASLDRNRFTIEALPLDTQLVQTKDLLNDRVIDSVVSLIQDASHIVFFCSGFSKYPCLEMAEKLKIMGKNTDTLSERHVMRHSAELLGKNDLVFSVSVSGETQV